MNNGVLWARAPSHRRSTLPPGVAWGTSREVAKSATKALRFVAVWWVGRWMVLGKGESRRRRPDLSGGCHSGGRRILVMLRAGQMMMGAVPRRMKVRNSFSIGDWKPPMKVRLALRKAKARS